MTDPAGAVFTALADPTRRFVVSYLAEGGAVTATELAEKLPISRQAVAKHLAALSDAGLVDASKVGRETRYRLTPDAFTEAMSWMADVGARWDRRLDALRRHVDRPRDETAAPEDAEPSA